MSEGIAGLSATAVALALIFSPTLQARSDAVSSELNQDLLGQVQTLYGIDQDQAIERLAREEIATETYLRIRSLELPGYAGAWLDDTTLNLQVATNDPAEQRLIERLGGRPILMAFSLSELETVRARVHCSLSGSIAVRESHIDYKTNRVVIGVAPSQLQLAQGTLGVLIQQTDMIQVTESKGHIITSSGNVRGGDGTRNYTWQQTNPGHESFPFPCSIGASVEGGYVTAGHCGRNTDEMRTPSGQSLGKVEGSTLTSWNTYLHGEDGAWVETDPGWTPQPSDQWLRRRGLLHPGELGRHPRSPNWRDGLPLRPDHGRTALWSGPGEEQGFSGIWPIWLHHGFRDDLYGRRRFRWPLSDAVGANARHKPWRFLSD